MENVIQFRQDAKHSDAVEFLKQFDPDGHHSIVAIDPNTGYTTGRTFPPGSWDAMEQFINERVEAQNLYFMVNEVKPGTEHKKPSKEDVANIRAVYVDVDPDDGLPLDEARKALAEEAKSVFADCMPSLIVDSGGGFNMYWPLKEKLPADEYREKAERQGYGLKLRIDGDSVHNIDRILRLPGTINHLSETKRARGRTDIRPTKLAQSKPERFTLDQIGKHYAPADPVNDKGDTRAEVRAAMAQIDMGFIKGHAEFADLPEDLQDRFDAARKANPILDDVWLGRRPPEDTSNSGWRFELAKFMKRDGTFTPNDYGALCWVWDIIDTAKLDKRDLARDWVNSPGRPLPIDMLEVMETEAEKAIEDMDEDDYYPVVTISDLRKRPLPEWLIDRHIPKVGVGFLYSRPGAGKSFVALDMSLHVCTGLSEWNTDAIKANETPRVLYIAAEGSYGFRDRVDAWEKYHGREVTHSFLMIERSINFMSTKDITRLRNTVRRHGTAFDLVVVDTVSRALPGADENLQKDMTLFVTACDAVKRLTGGAVLGVHHAGKNGDMRGSTVLVGGGDFVFKLERKPGHMIGSLYCEKQKDAPDGWTEPYAFETVDIDGARNSLVPTRCLETMGPESDLTPRITTTILEAMDAAWNAKEPWSMAPQSKDRFAVKRIIEDYGFKAEQAEEMVRVWTASGLLTVDIVDPKSKRKGLKVIGPIIQDVQYEDVFA